MKTKLSYYILDWDTNTQPGTKVMPANGTKKVGVILNCISPTEDELYVSYEVMWLTGKKAGLKETKSYNCLINLDKLLTDLKEEVQELEDLIAEGSKTGM